MPNRSAKACLTHGCRVLVRGSGSRCPEHARAKESARGSSTARGYDAGWRRLRGAHLSAHPMCSHPACDLIATDVDHVTPHRGDDRLRLDPDNLQSLCHGHHSSKTVAQDGGLGRARAAACAVVATPIVPYIDWYGTAKVQGTVIEPYPDEEPSL